MKPKKIYIYFILIAIAICLFLADILIGSSEISLKESLIALFGNGNELISKIIIDYRLPKAIAAAIAGASLGLCGLQMQTLFKNPLADPYILGISTGAGLGVALFTMGITILGIGGGIFESIGIVGAAWVGAIAITALILLLSHHLKDSLSLLIFGVMLSSIGGALIGLLQYLSSESALKSFVLWTMGSFSGLSYTEVSIMGIMVIIGIGISIYNIKDLNILLMGEDYAKSLGLNQKAIRRRILLATTLLAGGITAFCGPIGFLGIAIPHICKMLFKTANHRVLIPASILIGISAMTLADILSQISSTSGVIPINTISAILGVPVIFLIILKNKRR